MLHVKMYLQFMAVYFNIIYRMHQLRNRHIFLKIIETGFLNSKTNSIKKGWMKINQKSSNGKWLKQNHKILYYSYKIKVKSLKFQNKLTFNGFCVDDNEEFKLNIPTKEGDDSNPKSNQITIVRTSQQSNRLINIYIQIYDAYHHRS